jgi:hypothetical protein
MKKGALTALTVDSETNTKGNASSRLNADEIRECFVLKESCACDTKSKIGHWPDYNGPESLITQGCPDSALIAVASKEAMARSSLAFVHIVNTQSAIEYSDPNEDSGNEDSDDDDENGEVEFEMDLKSDCATNYESGDEEFEFE